VAVVQRAGTGEEVDELVAVLVIDERALGGIEDRREGAHVATYF